MTNLEDTAPFFTTFENHARVSGNSSFLNSPFIIILSYLDFEWYKECVCVCVCVCVCACARTQRYCWGTQACLGQSRNVLSKEIL